MPKPSASAEALRFKFPDGELDTWLVLGDVTDRSVRVWARRPAGPFEVSLCVGDETLAAATLVPDPAHDHVGAVTIALTAPRPDATVRVESVAGSRRVRLAPAVGEPAAFTFGFGSCHQPFSEQAPEGRLSRHAAAGIYPALREELARRDARFLLLLGDQVYSDSVTGLSVRKRLAEDPDLTDEELLETYRHLHRGYFNERGLRELVEGMPVYMTWDDHDIFDGAGSQLNPAAIDHRLRRAATGAYREYQHLRNPGASVDDEAPFSFDIWHGDIGFHVMDLRGCRDFQTGQIVGEAGWRRLERFLEQADAREVRTVFVALSVPLVHASPGLMALLERLPTSTGRDIRDRWDVPTFRHERERLTDLLFAWQAARSRRQVTLLSGDVHVAAAFSARPRHGRGRLMQWTSSALSTPTGWKHVAANRLVTSLVRLGEPSMRVWRHGLVATNNAGLVEVHPLPEGGHALTFRVLAFDPKTGRLREALTDTSAPA